MIPPYLAGARVSMHLCRAGMITRASPYSMYLYVIYSSERFTMFLLILVLLQRRAAREKKGRVEARPSAITVECHMTETLSGL